MLVPMPACICICMYSIYLCMHLRIVYVHIGIYIYTYMMYNKLYEYKDTEWNITLLWFLLLSIWYNSVPVAPPRPPRLPLDVGCCQSHREIYLFFFFNKQEQRFVYLSKCMPICIHACAHACVYASMHVSMYRLYLCMNLRIACIHIDICICIHISIHICVYTNTYMHIYIYVCV